MKKALFNIGDRLVTPVGNLTVVSVYFTEGRIAHVTVEWHSHQGTSEIPFSLFETWLPDVPEHTLDQVKEKLIELKDLAGDREMARNIVHNIGCAKNVMEIKPDFYDKVYAAAESEIELIKAQRDVSNKFLEICGTEAQRLLVPPPFSMSVDFKDYTLLQCQQMYAAIEEAKDRKRAHEAEKVEAAEIQNFHDRRVKFRERFGTDLLDRIFLDNINKKRYYEARAYTKAERDAVLARFDWYEARELKQLNDVRNELKKDFEAFAKTPGYRFFSPAIGGVFAFETFTAEDCGRFRAQMTQATWMAKSEEAGARWPWTVGYGMGRMRQRDVIRKAHVEPYRFVLYDETLKTKGEEKPFVYSTAVDRAVFHKVRDILGVTRRQHITDHPDGKKATIQALAEVIADLSR